MSLYRKARELPKPLAPEQVEGVKVTAEGPLSPSGHFYRIVLNTKYHDALVVHIVVLRDSHLHMTFSGSFGQCSYEWWHTGYSGVPIGGLHFAVQVGKDSDYLLRKMGQSRHRERLDGEETEQNLKHRIYERRREGSITKYAARDAWNDLEYVDCGNQYDAYGFIREHDDVLGDDLGDLMSFGYPLDLVTSCLVLYPVVADFIRDVLMKPPQTTLGI